MNNVHNIVITTKCNKFLLFLFIFVGKLFLHMMMNVILYEILFTYVVKRFIESYTNIYM